MRGFNENALNKLNAFKKELDDIGNQTIVRSYDGYHEWSPWRHSLFDFVQSILVI